MAEQPKPTITGKTLAQAAPKLPQMKNNPLTPEQVAAFSQLRNILDPTNQTFNPVSRLGAQMMLQEGKTMAHWQTPLNVLGLGFEKTYLPETLDESNMLKEAGLSPTSARGEIAIGPEALTGDRIDTVPHEVAHKALRYLGIPANSLDEVLVRNLMINNGLEVVENKEWLRQQKIRDDPAFLKTISEMIKSLSAKAEGELKKAKGK